MELRDAAWIDQCGDRAPEVRPVAPFLRWAGSKRHRLPFLRSFWSSDHSRYVEPFAGSAALFFYLRPRRALLSDLNAELIQAFDSVAAEPEQVSRELSRLRTGSDHYYRIRALEPKRLTSAARAARFIYLNRFCFNGLFRTNRLGQFNVPYGAPKTINVPTLEQLRSCAEVLEHARILRADFRVTLAHVRRGDFVYLDPPYAVTNRRIFVEYSASPFTIEDLKELAELLSEIASRGASFVVSYADCREARQALHRWGWRRIPARRHMAGFSGARRTQYEIYATNQLG